MRLSGFSMIHNALAGGYPIREAIRAVAPFVDEMIIVDMESTDNTRVVLADLAVTIIDGKWISGGGDAHCLDQAYALQMECKYDTIIHFEADEVYPQSLLENINSHLRSGETQLSILRLQVEQNFQRIRWYPEPVHRVFVKGSTIGHRAGHTTKIENQSVLIGGDVGYLWDVTNDFRDNFLTRIEQNADLHGSRPKYPMVPRHFCEPVYYTLDEIKEKLAEPHWTYMHTPLALPRILRGLLGKVKYE